MGSSSLQLSQREIPQHLAAGDVGGAPEGGQVEGGGEAVGEAEEEHGRDPAAGVLEGEAGLGHLVLLDGAAAQVVHGAGGEDLGHVLARRVRPLLAGEDVEVVVGRVPARVALCADGGAEDDEVFGYAWRGSGLVSSVCAVPVVSWLDLCRRPCPTSR